MLFPTMGPSSLPVAVAQPDEILYMQTEQLVCWSGMIDTEYGYRDVNLQQKVTRV